MRFRKPFRTCLGFFIVTIWSGTASADCADLINYRDGALFTEWNRQAELHGAYSEGLQDLHVYRAQLLADRDGFWMRGVGGASAVILQGISNGAEIMNALLALHPASGALGTVRQVVINQSLNAFSFVKSAQDYGLDYAVADFVVSTGSSQNSLLGALNIGKTLSSAVADHYTLQRDREGARIAYLDALSSVESQLKTILDRMHVPEAAASKANQIKNEIDRVCGTREATEKSPENRSGGADAMKREMSGMLEESAREDERLRESYRDSKQRIEAGVAERELEAEAQRRRQQYDAQRETEERKRAELAAQQVRERQENKPDSDNTLESLGQALGIGLQMYKSYNQMKSQQNTYRAPARSSSPKAPVPRPPAPYIRDDTAVSR